MDKKSTPSKPHSQGHSKADNSNFLNLPQDTERNKLRNDGGQTSRPQAKPDKSNNEQVSSPPFFNKNNSDANKDGKTSSGRTSPSSVGLPSLKLDEQTHEFNAIEGKQVKSRRGEER